jgi:mannose-6-phosphate isomerase-like protein (cupin superfamily)
MNQCRNIPTLSKTTVPGILPHSRRRGGSQVKRIVVHPGKRLSLQRHRRRAEHWYIIAGEAVVTLDSSDIPLKKGDAVDIPCGAAHRIMNPGDGDMTFIEVQTGDYFGEDDISSASRTISDAPADQARAPAPW